MLREYDLPARCLELELTESVLQTGAHTIKTLEQLRSIGVAVALDDFGTGYSSLASLQQLPLTRVKLDRSLIAGIDASARSASIARATIALCRGLGLEVTAEGVERVEQLATLLPHRAISLQGYLFSRPVCESDLLSLLERLPAQCQELVRAAQKLPAQAQAPRGGDRRKGALSLVVD
jgi:EAL domain-containing protein (putative c-di-GMP-specific phosphodiesterase class I)